VWIALRWSLVMMVGAAAEPVPLTLVTGWQTLIQEWR
jgi:hypothetical protein